MSEQTSSTLPVYVITGAAGGMGRATAERLGKLGQLLLADVAAPPLEETARQLREQGFQVETQICDVSKEESVKALAEKARTLGPLRGIAHTAGVSPTMGSWQRIVQINLVGTARLLQAFLPLAGSDTAVVCVASTAGHSGPGFASSYPALNAILDEPFSEKLEPKLEPVIALGRTKIDQSGLGYMLSKYGVIRLCESQATQWGAKGARLVSLSPGVIETPMGKQEFAQQPAMAKMVEQSPLKRMGQAEEIATALAFLLSKEASFITGCDLLVDGGVTGAANSGLKPTPVLQRLAIRVIIPFNKLKKRLGR